MAQQPQLVLAVHTVEAATAKVGGVEGVNAAMRPTDCFHVSLGAACAGQL